MPDEANEARRIEGESDRAGSAPPRLLVEGRTCWRIERADRIAWLVDGEAYFAAVARAIARAERQVLMLGWDFHSRVRLLRDGASDGLPEELAARLDAAVERNPRLDVHVLGWDFAMLYALERETLPLYRLGLRTRPRVHFRLDDRHPPGGSHHQKLVVVDDAIAFAGGFDLTSSRWDTRAHRARDPRRLDPGFGESAPFHDVQLAVDGPAAAALGDLARERWRCATGQRIAPPETRNDPWPAEVEPDLREVEVGIARTRPRYDGQSEVREVEALHLESIRGARSRIYVENQYLTAAAVGDALAERLREEDGPEIVIVAPRVCSGWLEETTMGTLRTRLLARLREADRFGRLRVFHPVVPDLGDGVVNVHAKVMVVDDRLLRIGSANLSNRSMGLDSECDLAIEAGEGEQDAPVRAAIERFRDGLLAEHLDVSVERVAQAIEAEGSLVAAVESLRGGARTLEPIVAEPSEWIEEWLPEELAFDPEKPIDTGAMLESFLPEEVAGEDRSLVWRLGLGVLGVIALVVVWRFTPLGEWIAPDRLASLGHWLAQDPLGPVVGAAAIAVGGCLMVPVTGMIVAAGMVFGWLVGFLTALSGALVATVVGYAIGRLLWRDAVRRLGGRRLNRLSAALGRQGVLAVAVVRLVPLAPFTVVNLVAGSSHVRLRDCLLGTLLGMGPGALALALFADRTKQAILDPGWSTILIVVGLAGMMGWGFIHLRDLLGDRAVPREKQEAGSESDAGGAGPRAR